MPPDEPNQNEETTPPVTEEEAPKQEVNLDEIRSIYNAALQEASQRATNAEAEVQRLRTSPPPPAPTPEEDRQNFFDNPRQLIREEMKQVIAPLNEFQQRYTKQEVYNSFLLKARGTAGFAQLENPEVLSRLAQAASQMPNISDEALAGAYNMIVGYMFSTGQISNGSTPINSNPPTPNPTVQPPPSPRPATPVPPVPINQNKVPVLNEHEKQLARFNNMSDKEYYDFLHMDKSEVARSAEVGK